MMGNAAHLRNNKDVESFPLNRLGDENVGGGSGTSSHSIGRARKAQANTLGTHDSERWYLVSSIVERNGKILRASTSIRR